MKRKMAGKVSERPVKKGKKESGLIWAYVHMLENIRAALERAEDKSKPRLDKAILAAKRSAKRHDKIHPDEVESAAFMLRKDLNDLGKYLVATGNALGDWLGLDWMVVEESLFQKMLSVSDKTRLEWEIFQHQAHLIEEQELYFVGDVVSAGIFRCIRCNRQQRIYNPHRLTVCKDCEGDSFKRVYAKRKLLH